MLFTQKEGRGADRTLLAVMLVSAIASTARTQSWSVPFNHNEYYNGNDRYTHPYSPWATLTGQAGAQSGTWTSAPPAAGMFTPIDNVIFQTGGGSGAVFFPPYTWPRPAEANGPSFNAVHMAVIPKGPYQGMVLVWNNLNVASTTNPNIPGIPALTNTLQAHQAYAIVDPADAPPETSPGSGIRIRYRNFLVPIGDPFPYPGGGVGFFGQNLFCAGHAWSPYGDLVVVGGTGYETMPGSPPPIGYLAGGLTYVFNPRLPCFWPGSGVAYYPQTPGSPSSVDYAGMWVQGPDLQRSRWYATATLTHGLQRMSSLGSGLSDLERILVLGGIETIPAMSNDEANWTYEALVVEAESAQQQSNLSQDQAFGRFGTGMTLVDSKIWNGPGIAPMAGSLPLDWLGEYPRCHLLSTGEIFFSGYAPHAACLDHDAAPGEWPQVASQPGQPAGTYSSNWNLLRHDGSAVLFPNLGGVYDRIARLGGADDFDGPTTDTMESIDAGTGGSWVAAPSMQAFQELPDGGRVFANVVILPTGGLLVVGGAWQDGLGAHVPVYAPMLFDNGTWSKMAPNPLKSSRTYHSTAVLLPDGRVFIGGGDDRDYDYEIFSPPYLGVPANRPVNPMWGAPAPPLDPNFNALALDRDVAYHVEFDPLPLGQAITKAVLMAPCSVTHHSDMHQRYVELRTEVADGNKVTFACAEGETVVPRGIYMLFFVSNTSVSHAIWVVLS